LVSPHGSPFFPEPIRVDDLQRLYPDFDNIYRRHVDEAKFDVVNDTNFKPLKERLTAEGDIRQAEGTSLKSDKKKDARKRLSVPKRITNSFRSKNTSEELLQKVAKNMTSDTSDSAFLGELKGIQDKDLVDPIREAMVLAHTYLSSLIDATVNTMTYAVLKMQQEESKTRVAHEVEREEREALDGIVLNFIRNINLNSAGRKTS
jgi:hypothetical protein